MYDIYPGSISDVSTLSGTLKKIKAHGIQNYVAVMDRGFFSLSNLRELMTNEISFIMAARLQLNDLKHLLLRVHCTIISCATRGGIININPR